MKSSHKPRRKGAARREDIPPDVLHALNKGLDETVTLVEWLAIDMPKLLGSILLGVGLADEAPALVKQALSLADAGVTSRMRGIGAAIHRAIDDRPDRDDIFEAMASYASDMVRAWANCALTADPAIPLEARLERARRFADDRAMSVREVAWDSFRPYVASDLKIGFRLLRPWVHDSKPNIRRCAVEGTRPRGVWTPHISALKEDPRMGLKLLEPVRSDDSDYVRRAVANWLNDASRSRPDWVIEVTDRWLSESPTKETRWTVNHALRTIRKTRR